ncbi:MAG: glycosyltransferase family 2 protein [Anaerolineales bacterium]
MTYPFKFTVFTPTYNRAHLLPRLCSSLTNQTYRNFEWLVIDDGSTDLTNQTMINLIEQSDFPIHYQYQNHAHKKTAFNLGVKLAQGELFLAVDSDDELLPNALEELLKYWELIPTEHRNRFIGVTGLRINEQGTLIGSAFPSSILDSNFLDVFYRYKVKGDKCGFFRTEILKVFPFPEDIPNHVPEGVVLSPIARKYLTRFINVPVLKSYKGEDQITNYKRDLRLLQNNAEGHAYWARQILDNDLDYFFNRPLWFFKIAANYTRFHLHMKKKKSRYHFPIYTNKAKILITLFFPVGVARFLLDYSRRMD